MTFNNRFIIHPTKPVPLTKTIVTDYHLPLLSSLPNLKKPLLTRGQKKSSCLLAREVRTANQLKSQHPTASQVPINNQPAYKTMAPLPFPSQ